MVNIGRLAICGALRTVGSCRDGGGVRPATPVRSAVIWTFNETSCTANNGSNCTFQSPGGLALAQLTLPDINSSGTWSGSFIASTHTFSSTGDTNFIFELGGGFS